MPFVITDSQGQTLGHLLSETDKAVWLLLIGIAPLPPWNGAHFFDPSAEKVVWQWAEQPMGSLHYHPARLALLRKVMTACIDRAAELKLPPPRWGWERVGIVRLYKALGPWSNAEGQQPIANRPPPRRPKTIGAPPPRRRQ